MGVHEHKKQAPRNVTLGIISVSTTRALIDDSSGQWMREQAEKIGHKVVFHEVIPDDAAKIAGTLKDGIKESNPQVILMSGGTGITKKDVTIEAVSPLFDKELSAFGPPVCQTQHGRNRFRSHHVPRHCRCYRQYGCVLHAGQPQCLQTGLFKTHFSRTGPSCKTCSRLND